MEDQAFKTLEYDQLRGLLRRGAQTPMGKTLVESLSPFADRKALDESLAALTEVVQLRKRGVVWSFSELADPTTSIARLRVEGATLEPTAILQLAQLTEQALSARAAIIAERERSPSLWRVVVDLPRDLNSVAARIFSKILPSGELDDRASPELARIRHEISRLRSSITRSLENLMRKSEAAVQDELVTIRNDRFVIPIKADHRARIQGVAHGFSSSGATAFIEPMETVESNNELQGLREVEQREIFRILSTLTEELRAQLPGIEMAATAIGELDFLNAKSVLYQQFNCVIPSIGESHRLELTAARHPLLEENLRASGSHVVPVSFALDEQHDAMVISGANAGGKTVVLKTAGLLSLMALSGLPVPATAATIPFYRTVLADIGDHQSIAANLSTFTSHIANISRMIRLCEAPALVLLDEVGTGTDPEEGSALGVAVVDHFRRSCGANLIATTHYGGLKMYAANEQQVLNASVEFDERTLQPTYRLIVGVAGASSGLEIARRFGVPEEIVKHAIGQVKDSSRTASEYLTRIKNESERATALTAALEEERKAVAEKFDSLEKQAEKHERERQASFETMLGDAIHDLEKRARELVATIEDRTERARVERETQKRISELKREAQRATTIPVAHAAGSNRTDREVRVVRDGQLVQKEQSVDAVAPQYQPSTARDIAVGDQVRVKTFGSIGIVDQIKNGEAEVRVKSLRFREKLENLELLQQVAAAKTDKGRFSKLRPTQNTEVHLKSGNESARSELKVIGQTTDEAVEAVDKFLDEAFLNSLSQVRIVHGHGTGALKRVIGDLLKAHPHVERFTPAPQDQGGSGATIVELKS